MTPALAPGAGSPPPGTPAPPVAGPAESLWGLTAPAIAEQLQALQLPPFRARQIAKWLYRRDAASFEEMSDLPKELRRRLSDGHALARPTLAGSHEARDGSRKYEIRLADGATVEAVLIAGGKRPTLCLSSQVGCAMACTFCRTGEMGLLRNLDRREIAAQVSLVRAHAGLTTSPMNYVFMGMGEPLHNADEVIAALALLTDPEGFGISPRRITVSTAGFLPGIEALAASGIPVKVAVSLTAPDDELRDRLVPVNRRYPIAEVLDACKRLNRRGGLRTSVAYVLLEGVNDAPEQARRLGRLLSGMPVKINLIPFNPYEGSPYRRPSDARVAEFRELLHAQGLLATVRQTHGDDVLGACGQLATAGNPPRKGALP